MQNYYYLLPCILHNAAKYFCDKTALVVGDVNYTYQEIYQDSLTFSAYLKNKKHEKNDRVLILSGNTYLTMIAFWGALFAELVPCIVDPDISSNALNYITKNIDPCLIIKNPRHEMPGISDGKENGYFLKGSLDPALKRGDCASPPVQKNVIMDEYCQSVHNHSFIFESTENELAIMMHTSGSTGYPKGVMLSHRNVIAAIDSISNYLCLLESDVILSVLPLHFDYGLYQMLLAFKVGATLVLEKNALFPHFLAKKIEDYRVSVLPCVPLLIQLLSVAFQGHSHDFTSIRIVTNTGESLSHQHIKKIKNLFPATAIFSMYGLTECKRCSYVPSHRLDQKWESIGIPIPNLSMWIQDADGNRVGPNIEGELVVSGPTVMMGYWRDSVETAKKINITPEHKKILITGDRAIMDAEGYFYFRGRKDFIVKFNGAKLNCHDYTRRLMLIDGVNRTYLFLTEIDELSQLVVCVEVDTVVCKTDCLKLNIISHFPSSQQPRYFYFTHQFPALGNGKLDKQLLENTASNQFLAVAR